MKPLLLALAVLATLALPSHAQAAVLPPTDLHGHYDASTNTLSLAWAPPLDATAETTYNVYQDGNLLATVTSSTFTDNLAPTGTASTFSVTAIQNGQQSAPAYTVFLLDGHTDVCEPIGVGLSPDFPYVFGVDWDCLWGILHFPP